MKILNFGSLNLDFVYKVDHFVQGGETLASFQLEKFCGGKGLNQSIALAKAGANVYHAGCIGKDGDSLLMILKENGVNFDSVRVIDEVSGHAIIQVDKNGENCILLYSGANGKVTEEHIDAVLSQFQEGDLVLLQNEINHIGDIIEKASKKGIKVAFNPSPIDEEIKKLPLEKVDYFILNEIEGKGITGKDKPDEIMEELKNCYPKSTIILTLGSKGSIYDNGETRCSYGVYKVEAVDTTAAGDTFTGYILSGLTVGKEPKEALRLASKASAIAVTRMGATSSIPTMDEVMNTELELREG